MTAPTPAPTAPPTNVLAIISLITAVLIAPVGIVLGFIAQNQIKTSGEGGAGLAKAGIIVGIVLTALWLLGIIVSIALPLLFLSSVPYTY